MTIDISAFSFDPAALALDSEASFVMYVPSGLTAKLPLFDAYQQGLNFPAYFGRNWDALSDCLRDFSWIAQRRIVIIHADFPALPPEDQRVYLEILSYCIKDWKQSEDHELIAFFATASRPAILDLSQRAEMSA